MQIWAHSFNSLLGLLVWHIKMSTKTVESRPFLRSWQELCTDRVICLEACMVVLGSLRPWFSMDSEAVEAGVFWMAPVRQHPHLDDLEGLIILLFDREGLQ